VPLHVNGDGESTILTNTAGMLFPHASKTIGAVGATASTTPSTVDAWFAGTTGATELLIV